MGLSGGDQAGRINSSHSIIQEFARSDRAGYFHGFMTYKGHNCLRLRRRCFKKFKKKLKKKFEEKKYIEKKSFEEKEKKSPAKIVFPTKGRGGKTNKKKCDRQTDSS